MYVVGARVQRGGLHKPPSSGHRKGVLIAICAVLLTAVAGFGAYKMLASGSIGIHAADVLFDASVTEAEQQAVLAVMGDQSLKKSVDVHVETSLTASDPERVLAAYVPVVNIYDTRQQVAKDELKDLNLFVLAGLDPAVRSPLAAALGVDEVKLADTSKEIPDGAVAFIPISELSPQVKLLTFEDSYYLDSFDKGAVFRQAVFSGEGADIASGLQLNEHATKDTTLKVNMTGVTALTRTMQTKLNSVNDAAYFSEKIGAFLADADITHVSNEVSFKAGCAYSTTKFCSPPQMIDALKAAGVDLVELTGNHNNDVGSIYNTESINLYHSLGWQTFGGGLNTEEAAKPYVADQKGNKVAFLAYNYADGPNSGAIAGADSAGANPFNVETITTDIAAAKQQGAFVVLDIQFWECQAYPGGYTEYPQCDGPIPNQSEVFRQMVDLGADMVVGTSAHQPQTYENYKGKPIYYGLGNLYFEQTQWPGTERGIILTHYFAGGKLIQTKLSPTVYGKDLQTRLMTADETTYLLQRLKTAAEEQL